MKVISQNDVKTAFDIIFPWQDAVWDVAALVLAACDLPETELFSQFHTKLFTDLLSPLLKAG
eukprot:5350543-Amphidinium_carterae.1